jgi:regulator of RNase E activity RraA
VPVEVAGLRIAPGEILHGDRHGIVTVPPGLAGRLPEAAEWIREREAGMCRFCASPGFSTAALRRMIETDAGRA